ncbi:MAG: serine acetyltransferase [Bacteroidetes bacterium]|nr:serine acetyltransferase [Bacteroidota bacterium]
MVDEHNNPRAVDYKPKGAEWLYYLSHRLFKCGYAKIASIAKRFNQFFFHVNIYPQVCIGRGLQLPHGGFGVVIHPDTVIGNDAIIFHNVTIANGGARIGDRVYIGTGSVILGAVTLGNDVVIGANSVVNFDVPDGGIVVSSKSFMIRK